MRECVGLLDASGQLTWCNRRLSKELTCEAGALTHPLSHVDWLDAGSVPALMRGLIAVETGLSPKGERLSAQVTLRSGTELLASLQSLPDGRIALLGRPPQTPKQAHALRPEQADFLANMSHELRSPLIGIIGWSELLLKGQLPPVHREPVQDIFDSGHHLLQMIEDALEYAKARQGRMTLRFSPTDGDDLMAECLTVARGVAVGRSLELKLSAGDLGVVHTDERLLKQIVTNLLSNAVKFTPDGGRVELAARVAGPWLQIAIRDTGKGMSEEDAARIFQAFYQADSSSSRSHGGLGLGLAIALRFVELLGGGIRVRSKPGVGSTFVVHVPLDGRRPPPRLGSEPRSELDSLPGE